LIDVMADIDGIDRAGGLSMVRLMMQSSDGHGVIGGGFYTG